MAGDEGQQHPLKIYWIMWGALFVLSGFSYATDFMDDGLVRQALILLFMFAKAGGIVWFDFEQLCGGPRSQNDYLELAQRFHTVILSDVPRLTAAMASQARRFLWLIDVLYDQRVKLLVSADCEPEQLYTDGAMAHEFVRTASRLREMQSSEYLSAPRRGLSRLLSDTGN